VLVLVLPLVLVLVLVVVTVSDGCVAGGVGMPLGSVDDTGRSQRGGSSRGGCSSGRPHTTGQRRKALS
jgi:hypothetical protein